jgi:hypothetical protein
VRISDRKDHVTPEITGKETPASLSWSKDTVSWCEILEIPGAISLQ